MKNCEYNIDQVCRNWNCIFNGRYTYDVCMYCEVGKEKEDISNEISPQYDLYGKEQDNKEKIDCCGDVIKIEGVGKDAEIVTNANGGKQSKSPMAAHLIDPEFLQRLTEYGAPIHYIAEFMETGSLYHLEQATRSIEDNNTQVFIRIAKVLQEGAEKYEPNNWRLIPQEEHINHALIHLFAAELGDTQDNHIDHALTRIMMAYATKTSEGFSYTKYIKKGE